MTTLTRIACTCALLLALATPLRAQDSFDQFVDPSAADEGEAAAPAEEAPAEEAAAEAAPAEEAAEEAPAEEEAVEEAPAEEAAEEAPTEELAESLPAEEAAESLPAEETAESMPAEELAESMPAEAPVEEPVAAPVVVEEPVAAPAGEPIYADGGLFGLGLVIGPKVGGGLSQVFVNGLGATFVGELELGYTLPLPQPLGRDFELFLSTAYAGPSGSETQQADARLPGDGSWSYELTLHQLVFTLGVLYRIPVPLSWLRPYAALGGRLYRSWTVVRGEADGEAFGENLEEATDLGGYGAVGADFFVGPGAILAELQVGFSPVDSYVMRDTNSGTLNLAVGYRFFL